MTDLREKLADLMDKTLGEMAKADTHYSKVPGILADAIIAALPGMVKPLEWNSDEAGDLVYVSLPDRTYRIEFRGIAFNDYRTVYMGEEIDTGGDENDAKDAANAHHLAAIMAALGVEGE